MCSAVRLLAAGRVLLTSDLFDRPSPYGSDILLADFSGSDYFLALRVHDMPGSYAGGNARSSTATRWKQALLAATRAQTRACTSRLLTWRIWAEVFVKACTSTCNFAAVRRGLKEWFVISRSSMSAERTPRMVMRRMLRMQMTAPQMRSAAHIKTRTRACDVTYLPLKCVFRNSSVACGCDFRLPSNPRMVLAYVF